MLYCSCIVYAHYFYAKLFYYYNIVNEGNAMM